MYYNFQNKNGSIVKMPFGSKEIAERFARLYGYKIVKPDDDYFSRKSKQNIDNMRRI